MNAGLIEALEALEKEKGISSDMLIESIELAMVSAYKKAKGFDGEIIARMDRETGDVHIYIVKTVVERLHNLETELSLEEAQEIDPRYQIGDRIQFEDTPKDFGRIGAQTARQVITQRLREGYHQYLRSETFEARKFEFAAYRKSYESERYIRYETYSGESISAEESYAIRSHYYARREIAGHAGEIEQLHHPVEYKTENHCESYTQNRSHIHLRRKPAPRARFLFRF